MTKGTKIVLGVLAATVFGATAGDAQIYPGVRFVAPLSGGIGGDPDGRGTVYVWADQARNRICATITVSNIQLPASSYLRVRTWGGPLVFMPAVKSSGCMVTDEYTAVMIRAMLTGSYMSMVGVNNAQYGRALVGYLHRG
jgi:hypothetical protein